MAGTPPPPSSSSSLAGIDAVLSAVHVDPEKVNVAALRGVSVPTPLAVKISTDALRAANQYYGLFFDEFEAGEADEQRDKSTRRKSSGGRRRSRDGWHGEPSSEHVYDTDSSRSTSTSSSSSSTSAATATFTDRNSSSGEDGKDKGDKGKTVNEESAEAGDKHTHTHTHQHHAHQHCHHHHKRAEAYESLATPVNVRNTNYHTFFPPPLTSRQRKHVVQRIIGKRKPRSFAQWAWHKAEEYHLLHARTLAQHESSAVLESHPAVAAAGLPSSPAPAPHPQPHYRSRTGGGIPPASATTRVPPSLPPVVSNASMSGTPEVGSTPSSVSPQHAMNRPSAFAGGYQVSPTVPDAHVAAFPTSTTNTAGMSGVQPRKAATPPPLLTSAKVAGGGPATAPVADGGSNAMRDIFRCILGASTERNSDGSTDEASVHPTALVASPVFQSSPQVQAARAAAALEESAAAVSPVVMANRKAAALAAAATPPGSSPSTGSSGAANHYIHPLSREEDTLDMVASPGSPASPHDHRSPEETGTVSNASVASAPVLGTYGRGAVDAQPFPLNHSNTSLHFDPESAMYTIPASRQGPEYFAQTAEDGTKTLVIVMVGLPARGKTFLAQKITRLLGWHGTKAKVQNIQVAWRRALLDWEQSQRKVDAMRKTYQQEQLSKAARAKAGGAISDSDENPIPATTTATVAAAAGELPMATTVTSHVPADIVARSAAEAEDAPACPSMVPFTEAAAPVATAAADDGGATIADAKRDDKAAGVGSGGKALCLRAEHFEHLLTDPCSIERRLYRQVLKSFATDCSLFFANGGEVIIINDDFVTEDLREEAEELFKPLAANFVFMEVMRNAEQNRRFNACKVKDPTEYPRDKISVREAKKDFDARLDLLERLYEPLADAKDPDSVGDENGKGKQQPLPPQEQSEADADASATTGAAAGRHAAPRHREPVVRSYIKIRNSDMIETHGIHGYLASRIISYVMNLSQVKIQHPIYFVRHGESCYNLEDRIGGNPLLTAQGMRDAAALLEFMDSLKSHLEHIDRQQQHRQRLIQEELARRQQQAEEARRKQQEREAAEQRNHSEDGSPLEDGGASGSAATPSSSSSPQSARQASAVVDTASFALSPFTTSSSFYPSAASQTSYNSSHPHNSGSASLPTANQSFSPGANGTAAPPLLSPHTRVDNSSANNLEIWTSQLRRTIQTAELSERLLNIKTLRWSSLNEIHAGICEDLTYAEVKKEYPVIEKFRKQSKYTFRYPEGESYQDLVVRLEPVIMELENADKVVVVVAHQAVLRCLLAYFGSTSAESSICVEVPHRTVWRCTYDSKGIASLEELKLDNWEAGFAPTRRGSREDVVDAQGNSIDNNNNEDEARRHLANIAREKDGI